MSNSVVEASEFYTICILECIRGLFDTVWNKDLFIIVTQLAGFVLYIFIFSAF